MHAGLIMGMLKYSAASSF